MSPSNESRIYFYRAVASYSANDKASTLANCRYVLDSFTQVTRYSNVASLMLADAETWQDGDLADVGREQRISGERLAKGLGDRETREAQQRALDKLDKLIKQLESPPSSSSSPTPTPQPARDSEVAPVDGLGKVDEKVIKKYAAEWGKLPPAERAKAIQELIGKSPPKWAAMIEDYQKGLNRSHP